MRTLWHVPLVYGVLTGFRCTANPVVNLNAWCIYKRLSIPKEDDSVDHYIQPCANACHVVPTLASLVKETDIPTYSSKSRLLRLILIRRFLPIV